MKMINFSFSNLIKADLAYIIKDEYLLQSKTLEEFKMRYRRLELKISSIDVSEIGVQTESNTYAFKNEYMNVNFEDTEFQCICERFGNCDTESSVNWIIESSDLGGTADLLVETNGVMRFVKLGELRFETL